jgi:hypothetical protein
VTEEMIQAALGEGQGRIALFGRENPTNPLLDIVVSVYKPTAHETLAYARDRMRDTFGGKFWQWEGVYAEIGPGRVRYLDGVDAPAAGIRIEVVDLGANLDRKRGMVLQDVRGSGSAHAAVIYAAAQDPAWVRQMDGASVPYAFAGGFELVVPGCDRCSSSPYVRNDGDGADLGASHIGSRDYGTASPSLREC